MRVSPRSVNLLVVAASITVFGFSWKIGNDLNAAENAARIVFLAGRPSHGYGAHEHLAGCRILADAIQRSTDGRVKCDVYENGWPEDDTVLQGADSIVMYCDGGAGHPALRHLPALTELMKAGTGFACLHYAVEVPPDRGGAEFLEWLGGYFETHWSVNPHWVADFTHLPEHPVTRGVKPFKANDEWYFHMRFQPEMQGVTPILSAIPGDDTMRRPDGPHSGNPAVRKAVAERIPQHTAWVYERPDGGRSFGFTGGHYHWNWGREEILRLVCNAICWTANYELPPEGLPVLRPSLERLEKGQDYPAPEDYQREEIQRNFDLSSNVKQLQSIASAPAIPIERSIVMDGPEKRRPANAVKGLKLAEGLEITLAASEPTLCSPTCMDIDHRGRVWICEVVNYRTHLGKRPEGDRIVILEDEDGDGVMDTSKVFYQGTEIDSAMGICVLDKQIIVSASPNIWIFTDENGDDVPDQKKLLFSNTGQAQNDHSAHSFIFGPDGKLYWNFGNAGHSVHDADGKPVIDSAGNPVVDNGKPYFDGMAFRCNLDGSQFETLAHNFRNNYELAVDAFGGIWQSDNDDDGNKAARINFVMEYGNYGYVDELTGASWHVPRANMEATIPLQHWHLNDPGVVPTLLITGAGSPAGITMYEGQLLPERFRNQLIHCEPGQSVVRAYPIVPEGAGYTATIENMVQAADDDWFRPVDVCTAPDGSLFMADWYDPGVGGHQMGDLDRGRIYRVAPPGVKYSVPELILSTPEGAAEALLSPNQATRFLAWQALAKMGKDAQSALERLASSSDSRTRARAYWALGKLAGSGRSAVASALSDANSDVRCMAVRLARQLKMSPSEYFVKVLSDPVPSVRRELAIALRFDPSPEMPGLWAALAAAYDGADRWYLEALGIGADRRWDECFTAYATRQSERGEAPHADIIWRARTTEARQHLVELLSSRDVTNETVQRLLRGLDYYSEDDRNFVLMKVVHNLRTDGQWSEARCGLLAESLVRLPDGDEFWRDSSIRDVVGRVLNHKYSRQLRVEVLERLEMNESAQHLTDLICDECWDNVTTTAAQLLLSRVRPEELHVVIDGMEEGQTLKFVEAIASVPPAQSRTGLLRLLTDSSLPTSSRIAAAKGVARSVRGARELLRLAQEGLLLRESYVHVGSLLRANPEESVRVRAEEIFPAAKGKSAEVIPELSQLVAMEGDLQRGAEIYRTTGTCAKCHPLDGVSKSVGPDLSEIGDKLAKEALFVSILDPSAGISHNYEAYAAVTDDGRVITGLIMSRTESQVILRDAEGIDHPLDPQTIDEFKKLDISLMPQNLPELLSVKELVDLVEYLHSLRK